ncbi:hypothetical protein GCM10019016_079320 [Streptomyces prasinosporus]|uniref:DUF2933 domain-containing protein n=2 Tax=Streptomyces TaxID=1883 RepID=A0ABP6U1H8_9ACTN|nr:MULTISPECIES: DUF2933 domain-containing protein [Streptomyces]MCG0062736.1 DUF2933 domain-containing protein [Streptomyces tricolor]GHC13831.1 hypothetical protein GCM10010332_49540 [Streptomyces albogriseolus]
MKPKLLTGIAVAAVAAVVLLWLGVPPYVLLLIALVAACPLSMAFMHGGHGGHGKAPYKRGDETSHPDHQPDGPGRTGLTKKGPHQH